jgi:hypothetical protein
MKWATDRTVVPAFASRQTRAAMRANVTQTGHGTHLITEQHKIPAQHPDSDRLFANFAGQFSGIP